MNKNMFALFRTPVMALAFLCALSACDMAYLGQAMDAEAPVIIEQPIGKSVWIGETGAALTVIASLPSGSDGSLRYQWYQYSIFREYQEQTGAPMPNGSGASFNPPTDKEGEFNYYVVVTNNNSKANGRKMNSVKSEPVTLAVNDPINARYPIISKHPTGGSVNWSRRMSLPVLEVAAAVEPEEYSDELRYQWYITDTLTNTVGTPIAGATASRLIPPVAVTDQDKNDKTLISKPGNYYYFAIVTNYFFVPGRRESSVASSPALVSISVNPNADTPVISGQPRNAIYFIDETTIAPLTVQAAEPEDGGKLSYQWYSNARSSNTDGTEITGARAASYTPIIDTSIRQSYYYYVVVTNTNENATNQTATTASRVAEISVMQVYGADDSNATFTVQFGGTNQYQYVRGFGGMDVAWGNFPNYNHPSLPSPLNSTDDYENMYNPDILGYNILRIMILPTYVDINRTLSELISNQIYTTMDRTRFYENVKTVNGYGGYVLASPWSPPAAWKTNNSINGGGDLRESDYLNYGRYLRAFAQNMLSNGAPVYAVSIQNEPNYTAGYDGCEWTSEQMRNFYRTPGVEHFTTGIAGYGGGKIIESVKTMNGESANTTTIHRPAMNTAAARVNIDILARHNYGSRNDNGAGTGAVASDNWIYNATNPREMWMTEHNLNSNSGTSYPNDHTWNYIWLFMNDVDMSIRINHEAAFIWWSSKRFYSMIGDGTYGCRDGEILPRGWGLAHYSKFAKESYRVGVDFSGKTKDGADLAEGVNINGSRYEDFTSETVKVSAFMKIKGGEVYPVNWRNKDVPVADIEEITLVMFTPTAQSGSGGFDMGKVKIQLPDGFKISGATAMRSNPTIFNAATTSRGTPVWETVRISSDRDAAYVDLPRSNILSVRFTQ